MSWRAGASYVPPSAVYVKAALIHEMGSEKAMPGLQQAYVSVHTCQHLKPLLRRGHDTLSPAGLGLCVRALRFPCALTEKLRVWGAKDLHKGHDGQHVFQTANSRLVVTKEPSHARKC